MEIVPFEPDHMLNIKMADIDADIVTFIGDIDKRAAHYAASGPAITLLEDGCVLAIGGVVQFWQGVGEAWMMVSPEGRSKRIALFKLMGRFLDDCFDRYGFHRIQASIVNGHRDAHRCALRLGFIPEGIMAHYGPKRENYVRYARLKGR